MHQDVRVLQSGKYDMCAFLILHHGLSVIVVFQHFYLTWLHTRSYMFMSLPNLIEKRDVFSLVSGLLILLALQQKGHLQHILLHAVISNKFSLLSLTSGETMEKMAG